MNYAEVKHRNNTYQIFQISIKSYLANPARMANCLHDLEFAAHYMHMSLLLLKSTQVYCDYCHAANVLHDKSEAERLMRFRRNPPKCRKHAAVKFLAIAVQARDRSSKVVLQNAHTRLAPNWRKKLSVALLSNCGFNSKIKRG